MSPSIFGCFVVGSVVPFMVRFSCVLYSAGSGVMSVVVVLLALSCRSFSFVHVCMLFRYGCSCVCAV